MSVSVVSAMSGMSLLFWCVVLVVCVCVGGVVLCRCVRV